ncbi:MAG: DNA polymerase III subunit beta [Bacteroidia bacterium]|nr:DNA polymerase III subunit beta [Bacteroidia bacterium]
MKFIVSSNALLKELQTISGVLNANNALPILDDFLFRLNKEELNIYASDLETTIMTTISVDSKDKGEITIPRLLIEMLKNFADQPLTFIVDTAKYGIEINSDSGKYKITGHDSEEFPKMIAVEKPTTLDLESDVLLTAINKTIFAVANDDLRPVMSGIYCNFSSNDVTFVATDAHKLVKYRRPIQGVEKENSVIIARKPMNLLKNILATKDGKVKVEYNKTNASFVAGNVQLTCRLIDGKYPNYDAVIPKENPNQLTIEREAFLSSLKRVSILSNKTTHQVRLKITDNALTLTSEDPDFSSEANERMACQYQGENMEIGFNSRFLLEMLSNLDSDEVKLQMSTPNRAGVITPNPQKDGEDILMLVMPVMLNN